MFLKNFSFWASLLIASLLPSCADKKQAPSASESVERIMNYNDEAAGRMALDEKFANYQRDVVLDSDGRISKDSKRSAFEGKRTSAKAGEWKGKNFTAERYEKKSWQGKKAFDRTAFAGASASRWNDQEWFLKKQAQEAKSDAGLQKAYATSQYKAGSAREQASLKVGKPENVMTERRRSLFSQPLKIDNEDYEKMSLNESKRLLGRD